MKKSYCIFLFILAFNFFYSCNLNNNEITDFDRIEINEDFSITIGYTWIDDHFDYNKPDGYHGRVPLNDLLKSTELKAGDLIHFRWKGISDHNIKKLLISLIDDSPAANGYLELTDFIEVSNIVTGKEFSFDFSFSVKTSPIENVTLNIYAFMGDMDEDTNIKATLPKAKTYTTYNGIKYELAFEDDFTSSDKVSSNWYNTSESFGKSKSGEYEIIWDTNNAFIRDGKLILKINVDKQNKIVRTSHLSMKRLFNMKGMWEFRFYAPYSTGGEHFVFLISPNTDQGFGVPLSDGATLIEFTALETFPRRNQYGVTILGQKNPIGGTDYSNNQYVQYTDEKIRYFTPGPDFYNNWHNMKYIFEDDKIELYLDDTQLYSIPIPTAIKEYGLEKILGQVYIATDLMGEWDGPFDSDMPDTEYMYDYIKVWKPES